MSTAAASAPLSVTPTRDASGLLRGDGRLDASALPISSVHQDTAFPRDTGSLPGASALWNASGHPDATPQTTAAGPLSTAAALLSAAKGLPSIITRQRAGSRRTGSGPREHARLQTLAHSATVLQPLATGPQSEQTYKTSTILRRADSSKSLDGHRRQPTLPGGRKSWCRRREAKQQGFNRLQQISTPPSVHQLVRRRIRVHPSQWSRSSPRLLNPSYLLRNRRCPSAARYSH